MIRAAWASKSHDDFAARLGREYTDDFINEVFDIEPGVENILQAKEEQLEAEDARRHGDIESLKAHRKIILTNVDAALRAGCSLQLLAASPDSKPKAKAAAKPTVRPARARVAKPKAPSSQRPIDESKLVAVAAEEVESDVMRPDVLGKTGETYCGRTVVVVRRRPGVFGGTGRGERLKRYTLHKGVLNMSDFSFERPPTVYWAVLDAISEIKADFTKSDVVAMAVKTLSANGGEGSDKAAGVAFDVLKTHTTHPTKRGSGMCHMVDEVPDKKREGERVMRVRARRADETLSKVIAVKSAVESARSSGKPARTEVVRDFV